MLELRHNTFQLHIPPIKKMMAFNSKTPFDLSSIEQKESCTQTATWPLLSRRQQLQLQEQRVPGGQ